MTTSCTSHHRQQFNVCASGQTGLTGLIIYNNIEVWPLAARDPVTDSHPFLYDTATIVHLNTHSMLYQAPLFYTKEAFVRACACVCFLTYEGAPFGVEFRRHANAGAQVEHHQHGNDHDDTLQQQQGVEVPTKSVGGDTGMCACTEKSALQQDT